MNLQKHHLGQISGQVSNQAGAMLLGLPHQNGNPVPGQMQNPNAPRNVQSMDPEIGKLTHSVSALCWEFLMQWRQQSHEVPTKKMIDLVKRLEEGLFKSATTKEEYLNLATLESRLHILIKRFPTSNHNQQFSHANSSPPVAETAEDLQPPLTRIKIKPDHQILVPESERSVALASNVNDYHVQDAQHNEQRHDSHIAMKSETTEVKMELPGSVAFGQLSRKNTEMKDNLDDVRVQSPEGGP
ncbi:Histone acetyltransferase HAC12 [Sesamum alatum]|uniref:Histone acetyltransferase HAC12 n=1 Tax=Sesamum alatum TaxID=300844 RepID=A0AAE1YCX1_9LAMI|nr:Histone acetyltransferase HAC12 [Sesamum alatum]